MNRLLKNVIESIKRLLRNKTLSVVQHDEDFIQIQNQKFHYNRAGLLPLIEQSENRDSMVEVGSLCGFSTRYFSLYFKEVISVDPYISGYDENDINSNNSRLRVARDVFKLRFFDDPKVRQINKPSKDAAADIPNESLDFIYIDAGHNYDAVKEDIISWKPKLRSKGVMAGDDYHWPGLKKAVSELLPNHAEIDGRWYVKLS